MKQIDEGLKIAQSKVIDTAVSGSYLFTGKAEGIFVGNQQVGQVVLPQVLVETIVGGKLEQPLDLGEDPGAKLFPGLAVILKAAEDVAKLHQDGIRRHVAVD